MNCVMTEPVKVLPVIPVFCKTEVNADIFYLRQAGEIDTLVLFLFGEVGEESDSQEET